MNRREFLVSSTGLLIAQGKLRGEGTAPPAASDIPVSLGIGDSRSGFDTTIQRYLQETGAPGCAFAIVRNGHITYSRGYGYANRENRELFTSKSLYRIASLTKNLTSFTILRLMEQGKLSLTDRVFPLLGVKPYPEDSQVDPRMDKITIEQCLNMTGGWSSSKAKFDRGDRAISLGVKAGLPFPNPPDMYVRMLYGMGLDFEPGTQQEYANEGYTLLGRVIAKVTGKSCIDIFKEYTGVKALTGAHSRQEEKYPGEVTYYSEKPPIARSLWPQDNGKMVPWYYGSGQPLESDDGAGNLVCSIEDYAGFLARLSDPAHPFLRQDTWARISALPPCLRDKNPQSWYGLGWFLFREGDHLNFIHGGVTFGSSAKVSSRPDGQSLLVFVNYNNVKLDFHDLFMPKLHEAANKGN